MKKPLIMMAFVTALTLVVAYYFTWMLLALIEYFRS